jgi:hypothetical protein
MPLMFENLYDAKGLMKNFINQSEVDVRSALNSGARADIPGPPLWANALNRYAIAERRGSS